MTAKYLSQGHKGTKRRAKINTQSSGSIILLSVFAFLLIGCSSMVQKGGEILEGSAFEEMELSRYQSAGKGAKIELRELGEKDGSVSLEITSSAWPGFALRGGRPGGSGNIELREARILSSHVQGWNEFTLDVLGKANFDDPKKTGGVLRISGAVERVQISSGKIRLKSSRLTGTAALTPLRNRRERILALIEWMGQYEQTSLIDQSVAANQAFASQKEFENFWKPRLLPELVSRKKRPPAYSARNAQWHKADSIKWNQTYTEQFFPEGLWEYRNSGGLLRDWEEALPWIYMEYSWDRLIGSFDEVTLQKIK